VWQEEKKIEDRQAQTQEKEKGEPAQEEKEVVR
jgi:hypothetical protein